MTIWREFRGGGAPVQVARRVGRILRSGIRIVLMTPTGRRSSSCSSSSSVVLVMMLASTGSSSSTAGPTTTPTSSALFHIRAEPLSQGRTAAGRSSSLQQQPPQGKVEIERIPAGATHLLLAFTFIFQIVDDIRLAL